MIKRIVFGSLIVLVGMLAWFHAYAQQSVPGKETDAKSAILLTIFLRHDQGKTLEEINKHLDKTGFWKEFPPPGTEIVSWYVMMGIGQVITVRVPPEKLRDVNLVIEKRAWGAYRSEFYATYDFRPVWEANFKKK